MKETSDKIIERKENLRESALKIIDFIEKAKWILTLSAAFISLSFISKYLWAIGHPELMLDSISNPTNIFIWLAYVLITLIIILLSFVVPSSCFALSMQLFSTKEVDRKYLARTLAKCSALCFAIFLLSIILLFFDLHPPVYATYLASIFGAFIYLLHELPKRNKDLTAHLLKELADTKKINRASAIYNFSALVFLTSFTAMCCLFFPMQLVLKAWRGAEHGLTAGISIIATLAAMYIYLFPAIFYYSLFKGDRVEKAKKAAVVMITALILNFALMPSLLDIWAYAAANLIKIRDNRTFLYAIDSKDYPPTIFPKDEWSTKASSSEFYTISGFRQFKFGSILLLCPSKYSTTELKDIYKYSKKCISLASEKAKPITEVEKEKEFPPYQKT
ncbi:hypothetical protein [Pseudomonas sp. LA5]|uniref:hypothetical protein n=1 Tax=Pseudomonas sp. LA5 TaxID=3027850 RepID=UPI00235FEB0D|nr:hypothetical protein [Pseudomonas sp. LA5]